MGGRQVSGKQSKARTASHNSVPTVQASTWRAPTFVQQLGQTQYKREIRSSTGKDQAGPHPRTFVQQLGVRLGADLCKIKGAERAAEKALPLPVGTPGRGSTAV